MTSYIIWCVLIMFVTITSEIKRMLISGYAENLQLRQEQVKEIKVSLL